MNSHTLNWTVRHGRAVPLLVLFFIIFFIFLDAVAPQLVLFGATILFLAGIPHGATERLDGPDTAFGSSGLARRPTLAYTAMYIVFGILVMASWLISPASTLVCFLGLSAWHFARAEPDTLVAIWRYSAGLWVIIGSFALYPAETLAIFEVIIGQRQDLSATMTVGTETSLQIGLQMLSTVMLIVIIMMSLVALTGRKRSASKTQFVRAATFIALFLTLPPIPAVAVYFFAVHSLGETAKTLDTLDGGLLHWLKIYAPASLPALVGASGLLSFVVFGIMPIPLAAGLSVAFIVPHMLPLERLTQAPAHFQQGETAH